jgi:predicted membrane protein
MLRLNSIAGRIVVEQVHAAEISSLANGLTIGLAQPGEQGIRISSITGGVDLIVAPGVNANLRVNSLMGQIRNEAPDVSVSEMKSGFQIVIGSGGKANSISIIIGGIRIRH